MKGKEPAKEGSSAPAEPAPAIEIDRQAIRNWREYQSRTDMAVAVIIQGLTDEMARKYCGTESISNPVAVWRQIEADHRDKLKLNMHHLRIQLCDVKLEECGSSEAYTERFQSLCNQITLTGQTVSGRERFFYIMEGLPSEWGNYRDVMAGRATTSDA